MKRIFALLFALVMCLSLVACGGGDEDKTPADDSTPPSSSQDQNAPDPGASEPDSSDADEQIPAGVSIPTDKYGFLDGLVLPDDAAVSEVDDAYYAEDKEISMIVKPMTPDKVTAYEQKLADAGYTDDGLSGLLSPDGKFNLIVDDSLIDLGYISLAIFEVTE